MDEQIKYALNLGEDGRILSATYPQYASEGMPIVDELPEGDVTDYIYTEDGYVYDPIATEEDFEQALEDLGVLDEATEEDYMEALKALGVLNEEE